MPPKGGNKAEQKLKEQPEALKSKLKSSPQPRFLHSSSTPSSRDTSKDSKSILARKSDVLSKKAPKDPPRSSSISPDPPKVSPSQPTATETADSLKPPSQPQKKGFWNWRPFRAPALTNPSINTPQRFHVLFSLHVHSIQNIPASLNGLRLILHWNRKEEGLQTMPSRVLGGKAEFDEILRQRCTVHGTCNANQWMEYEPKLFTISVVALDVDELELGKHHIDLSRLLPEEFDTGQVTHSWSTNFELSGMAKGSNLLVTFHYDLLHLEASEEGNGTLKATIANTTSTPSLMNPRSFPAGDKAYKVGTAYENAALKKNQASIAAVDEHKVNNKNISEDWSDDSQPEEEKLHEEDQFLNSLSLDLDEEVELVAGQFLDMLDFGLSPEGFNLDGEPDSPRAKLFKQFQHDSLFGGEGEVNFRLENSVTRKHGKLFGTTEEQYPGGFHSTVSGDDNDSEDGLELASIMEAAELELQKAAQSVHRKSKAKELEDEETQALMQRWGLSETSFHDSPSGSMSGLGKPVFGPHLNNPPPLGKGSASVLHFEDGGSLRSMSSSHLSKNKVSGSLVMQSSKPVVVPSTMGSSAVDILRHLASLGTETLAKQAMATMPLEDITGKVADEILSMGTSAPHASGQRGNWHPNASASNLQTSKKGGYDDYVSLEDLAPLAMQNIEALAIDGLKVQADVADEEAPSYLDALAWGILGDLKKDSISLSHDVAGLHFDNFQLGENELSDVKEGGPLSMALTLEEWLKLDAGIIDDDANCKERSLAILTAHNANYHDWQLTKGQQKKQGNMGNTLMIAMLVQLRDPLQNFEPVGAPMLTLIQAERVMLPPKPRFGRNVSMTGNSEVDEDDLGETLVQKEEAPQFKLTGVHMSGLKNLDDETGSGKVTETPNKGWGSQKQLESGSRWLAAQGMKRGSKPSLLKGKPAPSIQQTKVKPGETLWSISAKVNGAGRKWRELAALNPHIRNPDVIFSNDTIRTR